ncbi:hypothetical protein TWF281_009403 [Arthrobotrys megalospora]
MTQLVDLPPEILHLILDDLPRRSRYQVALTCKYISLLAVPGLYSVCYFRFCSQRKTHLLCGPVESTTVNYLTYEKYQKAVRHLRVNHDRYFPDRILEVFPPPAGELENGYPHEIKNLSSSAFIHGELVSSQLDHLLPAFTGLKTIDLRNSRYGCTLADTRRQIQTIQAIVTTCRLLKTLFVEIMYDGRTGSLGIDELRIGDQSTPDYPRLTSLAIQLTEMFYNDSLEPVRCLLSSLCKLLHASARSLKWFQFGFLVTSHAAHWETAIPWYQLVLHRGGRGWPKLDLPMVETVSLDFGEDPEICECIFSEYFCFDTTKVKRLMLKNADGTHGIGGEVAHHYGRFSLEVLKREGNTTLARVVH